jgi:hypothetical protein
MHASRCGECEAGRRWRTLPVSLGDARQITSAKCPWGGGTRQRGSRTVDLNPCRGRSSATRDLVVSIAKRSGDRGSRSVSWSRRRTLGLVWEVETFDLPRWFRCCTCAAWWTRPRDYQGVGGQGADDRDRALGGRVRARSFPYRSPRCFGAARTDTCRSGSRPDNSARWWATISAVGPFFEPCAEALDACVRPRQICFITLASAIGHATDVDKLRVSSRSDAVCVPSLQVLLVCDGVRRTPIGSP